MININALYDMICQNRKKNTLEKGVTEDKKKYKQSK